MTSPPLVPDCGRCAALCCVALAMDASDMFAIDKPAGDPCPNLDGCARCTIHADLLTRGFRGCVQFDCLGAGQRVVGDLFEGRSWLDEPRLLSAMSECFHLMRQVQELHQLLDLAGGWPLVPAERYRLGRLRKKLEPGWTQSTLCPVTIQSLKDKVHAFLKTLAHHAGKP